MVISASSHMGVGTGTLIKEQESRESAFCFDFLIKVFSLSFALTQVYA